jgi:hypothetical protein
MSYVYRVIRSFGDIVSFECVTEESTFGGKAVGNEYLITRKNGFIEMFTTEEQIDEHWFGLFAHFYDTDSTVGIGQFY